MFSQQVSIHGRRLALTTTNGIGQQSSGSTRAVKTLDRIAQMWGSGMLETVSSSGAVLVSHGVSVLAAASATAQNYDLSQPVAGIQKEILLNTSASAVTISNTATSILFRSSGGSGSTVISVITAAPVQGESLQLRGLSTAIWFVVNGGSIGVST